MNQVIFLILYSVTCTSAFIKTENQENIKYVTNCVVKILEDIDFKKYRNQMDVTLMNMNNDLELSAIYKVNNSRFISRRFFWETDNLSNIIYVVMSEDYQELEHGLSKVIADTFWNPSARFIIVLKSLVNHSLDDVTDLLQTYNMFYKVSVITPEGDDYAIYKYNLTTPGYCIKSAHLKFWSCCSEYRSEKSLHVVLNSENIRGCQFKFITHNLWPYMNFDTDTKGIEQYLLSIFEKLNGVKIDLVEFGKLNRYGNIVDNMSKIMLTKVVTKEVEGAVGGYSMRAESSGHLSYTYPVIIDHMFFILAHADYLGQWGAFTLQALNSCIVIGLCFVIFCIAATLLSIFPTRERDISHNVLVVFGYLLNKTFVKTTKPGLPQALVFTCLLFFAFIVPYAIQASLFSLTARPVRGYEPKAIEDLKNLEPIIYKEWKNRFNFEKQWICESRVNCLLSVKNCANKSLYTLVSNCQYEVNKWLLTDDQCNMAMYRLQEPYMAVLRAVVLRRGSALVRPMNRFLLRVATTGIIDKYSSNIFHREWLRCKSRYRPQHVPLTLADFYYIFLILVVGYCLSLLLLFFEIVLGSQNTVRT